MAATLLAKEIVFMRGLAAELGFKQTQPTQCAIDNEVAIAMTCSKMLTSRNKHIRRREHYVREQVAEGEIKCGWVSNKYQFADLMTKWLRKDLFVKFRDMIMK